MMAIPIVGLGALMLLLSFFVGAHPMVQALGKALRLVAPYPLVIGLALLALYAVLRPKPDVAPSRNQEPSFDKNTTGPPGAARKEQPDIPPELPPRRGQATPATTWSARVFDDIEWRRFEALCGSLFAQAGFETRAQSHGADGGVDIWLHSRHADGPASIVQCKHWLGKPVGVKEIREFFGVMASHKLNRGTYATSSTFTADASQFAKSNGISTLDRQGLLALIAKRMPEQQQALLAVAYEGEYWRPTCASCGVKMVERTSRGKKGSFWGCVNFPKCRFTLPARGANATAADVG
jgi:restriction system protein